MIIQPIVEGYGEVAAFPVLLRRLVEEAQAWTVSIGRPIRRSRYQLVQKTEVERSVQLALKQQNCGAILILFDGDDDCPAELGPTVQAWAVAIANDIPCGVVIAHREYEAWFLSAIESLRGYRGVLDDAEPHPNPENPRGAKERLEARMHAGASYLERTDQPTFSEKFSLSDAYRRSRSFRKLASSYFAGLGLNITVEDSSHGRVDMAVHFNDNIYLFEFKVVELASEGAAMAQLQAKGYACLPSKARRGQADKYRGLDQPIYLIGVEFSKDTRNITAFEVADA